MKADRMKTHLRIIDTLNSALHYIIVCVLIVGAYLLYIALDSDRHEPLPLETINPQLLSTLDSYEKVSLTDDGYVIQLEPKSDIGLAVYQTVSSAEGMPFRITNGKDTAESSSDGYCILNGEIIATLDDLAARSLDLRRRLHTESIFSPDELAIWDLYFGMTYNGHSSTAAYEAVAAELGLSIEEAQNYMQFLFHREQGHHKLLTPELFRDEILTPAISFHPGTAGSTLGRAQAAANILQFITKYLLRFVPEEQMSTLMADAYALLSEEEQGWLQENLPGLEDFIDYAFTDYAEVKGIFEDAGVDYIMQSVLAIEKAPEDWACVRLAMGMILDVPATNG